MNFGVLTVVGIRSVGCDIFCRLTWLCSGLICRRFPVRISIRTPPFFVEGFRIFRQYPPGICLSGTTISPRPPRLSSVLIYRWMNE